MQRTCKPVCSCSELTLKKNLQLDPLLADGFEGMQQIRFIRTCEGSYVAYASDVNLACRAPSRREAFQTLRKFLALGRPALAEKGERRLGKCVVFRPEAGGYHPSMEQVTQTAPSNVHTWHSV